MFFLFFRYPLWQPSTLDNKARALGTDERVNWVFVRGIISLISLTYQSLTFRSSYVRIISIAPRAQPPLTSSGSDPISGYESLFTLPEDESLTHLLGQARSGETEKEREPADVIISSILLTRFVRIDLRRSYTCVRFRYSSRRWDN